MNLGSCYILSDLDKELLAFYRSYSRVVNQCMNSSWDHGFITHNRICCGSCGLTYNTKRRLKRIKDLMK